MSERHAGPEAGQWWVLVTPEGERDLAEVLEVLYQAWPRSREVCVALLLAGLHRGLVPQAAVVNDLLEWRRGNEADRPRMSTRILGSHGVTELNALEDLGYAVLCHRPVDQTTYRSWVQGGTAMVDAPPLRAEQLRPRDDLPDDLRRLFDPWLACYRRVNRPVGLYWLLPLWYWVLAPTLGWSAPLQLRLRTVAACPWRPGPPAEVAICEGLPPGCGVAVHHWPVGQWRQRRKGVCYLMQYQCQVLAGALGSQPRAYAAALRADTIDMHPDLDDLYMLIVGGVPCATAFVATRNADGRWYIGMLCGHTRSGAGALLIQYLQSAAAATPGVRGLSLSAINQRTREVYAARGFRSLPEYADGREMVWDV